MPNAEKLARLAVTVLLPVAGILPWAVSLLSRPVQGPGPATGSATGSGLDPTTIRAFQQTRICRGVSRMGALRRAR